jgi:hypothetical protein
MLTKIIELIGKRIKAKGKRLKAKGNWYSYFGLRFSSHLRTFQRPTIMNLRSIGHPVHFAGPLTFCPLSSVF